MSLGHTLGISASLYDRNLAAVDNYLDAKTEGVANFGNILATILAIIQYVILLLLVILSY
jgi:hypothetical protein